MSSTEAAGDTVLWQRRAFSDRTKRVMRSLAEAMFDDDTLPREEMSARLDWLIDQADLLAGAATLIPRTGLAGMLFVVQLFPLFYGFGFTLMSSMPKERRVHYLEKLERSQLGLAFFGWKTVLSVSYFEHPDALRETGYDGQCRAGEGSFLDDSRAPSKRLPVVIGVGR